MIRLSLFLSISILGSLAFLNSGCTTLSSASNRGASHTGFSQLLDAVVRIDVWETRLESGAERTGRGVGSGVIMDSEGYILTNAHVVSPQATRIVVTLNSLERVEAELVGWDHWTDLAVIRMDMKEVEEKNLAFSVARFGDSARLQPGIDVLAVGTPNGLSRTVTRGIISNTNRYFEARRGVRGYETGNFNTWLQTDAAINPGNSGGPLVLKDGRVIGINTRGYLGANNLGFAVPSEIAEDVMAELIADGIKKRSYIGINPSPLQDLESFFKVDMNAGVLVESADTGSPADLAGLRAGDIIMAINGESVDGRFPEQLPIFQRKIAESAVGSEVAVDLQRNGSTMTLKIPSELLESRMGDEAALAEWGISVRDLTLRVAREQRFDSDDGAQVINVQKGYPGQDAGLMAGDVILSVNRRKIANLADLKQVFENWVATDPQEDALLEVLRNYRVQYLVLKPR